MSERPLRCVMVGGGPDSFMGPVHRQAMGLYGLAVTVGGVFSRKPEKNAAMAEVLRVPPEDIFADLDALIAALPRLQADFAVVITPTPDHYEPVTRLLKAGLPVVCDKPLCSTVAEAEEIADLAERLRLPVMVTYTYAGYAMPEEARDLVARGVLGSIRLVCGEYRQESLARKPLDGPEAPRAWRFDAGRASAFCVEDIGVHLEYLIRHITGQAPRELSARLHTFTPGLKLDDNAFIWATLDQGAEVSAVCSKVSVGSHNRILVQVIGDKGSLEWRHSEPELLPPVPAERARARVAARRCRPLCPDAATFPCAHRTSAGLHGSLFRSVHRFLSGAARTQTRRGPHCLPLSHRPRRRSGGALCPCLSEQSRPQRRACPRIISE